MRIYRATTIASILLLLAACGGPDLPSYSAIKLELDSISDNNKIAIIQILQGKYSLDVSKAATSERKETKDKTVTTFTWWKAVKLDGNAVAPDHRGHVGHLILTKTVVRSLATASGLGI
jgi:hypothetical protein